MNIIGTCGFCSTGSSAVSDYLKEFDQNQALDRIEFIFPYLPDGLADLEYHLMKHITRDDSSSIAIPRFRRFMKHHAEGLISKYGIPKEIIEELTENYINSLVQVRFRSVRRSYPLLYPTKFYSYFGWNIMRTKVFLRLNNRAGHPVTKFWPCQDVEISVNPCNFYDATKQFVIDLLALMGADFNKNIILDQPFAGDDPVASFHYYSNPLAIVVDRDPRDNYLFTKKFLYKSHVNHMPTDTAEHFVEYYRTLRENRPYTQQDDRVLVMHFEEMVYDYENATRKVREFCNLPENPHPKSVFEPKLSAANTQLFKRFPEYANDIKYIEEQLPEYLFDFNKYPQMDLSGKMFKGKSPLNK